MKVRFLPCEDSPTAGGLVIVVDVISAFTTAAWLFEQNAPSILVAETAAHARSLKEEDPTRCLVGEENGRLIEGFDYPNDLTRFRGVDFTGRTCVLKTSAGTRGLIANRHARCLLAVSLCNARATADYVRAAAPDALTFVITNNFKSAEDPACATYICECLFGNDTLRADPYRAVVDASRYAADTRRNGTDEMRHILEVDRFDFVMLCSPEDSRLTITRTQLPKGGDEA